MFLTFTFIFATTIECAKHNLVLVPNMVREIRIVRSVGKMTLRNFCPHQIIMGVRNISLNIRYQLSSIEMINRGIVRKGDQGRENSRATPESQLKWSIASRLINSAHNLETNLRQGMNPAFLVLLNVKMDALIDSFICFFTRSVRLWMKT